MNTEIFEYFKKLSQKENFLINFINSILGIAIIILAVLGLADGVTVVTYALMFGFGAIMLLLNFVKKVKTKGLLKWIFLISAIVFAALSGLFIYGMML